jgi:DNA polymerase III epsilon subunit-like protein
MQILTLDFEGSLSNGIREIGLIKSENSTIVSLAEQTIQNDSECLEFFKTIFNKIPNFIISHNVPTEKNLLKKYLPYSIITNTNQGVEWGPWLDTKEMYRILYPQLEEYGLEYLTNIFIKEDSFELAKKHCRKDKRTPHNALYDAICAFLLYKRLAKTINIKQFIR